MSSIHYGIVIIGSLMAIIGGFLIGREIWAQSLTLSFSGLLPILETQSFSIHFGGGGNNYPGALVIDSLETLNTGQAVDVIFNNTTLHCNRKIHGYYFNSARGLRVWPLSNNSLNNLIGADNSYSSLSMVGGLYTSCSGNPQDIVGYIGYQDNGSPAGGIWFGLETDRANNSVVNNSTDFSSGAFIIQNFTTPVGYLYDSIVGVGYIGGSGNIITGNILNSFWNIAVQGRLGISKVVDTTERTALRGNTGKKSIVYTSDETTTAKIINTALKNAQGYCRGGENTDDIQSLGTSRVVCYDDGTQGGSIIIDGTIADELKDRDLVVRNKNVVISKSAFGKPLSIFIDKGNLLIDNNISASYLSDFDKNGYITNNGVTQGIYLQGNYIINGLIMGTNNNGTSYAPIEAKTFIHGKLASLNLPSSSYTKREQQIQQLFGQNNYNLMSPFITLQNVFTRKCNSVSGLGSSGVNNVNIGPSIACNDTNDNHLFSSLVVIEKNYPTKLLN